jgi:hypothetical protein
MKFAKDVSSEKRLRAQVLIILFERGIKYTCIKMR